ncbi:MAG: hypothetical protein J6Y78_04655 [Paludibacteraceae bacterium]|nr:hypothetical protein [Paludibacteraceae bacterium]
MIKNERRINWLQNRIKRCEEDIENGINVEIREKQLVNFVDSLLRMNHIRRQVKTWEKAKFKWFNGSESDVASFGDLATHCEESVFDEKPLDLIIDGVYIPIVGSAIEPWDLRHYLFLPASLVEDDEDIRTIKKAFEDYSITGD